jgi:D-alanine transaminase
MSRIVYINGRYRAYADAYVHFDDRGYQFGDGVYEVCEVRDRRLIDESSHLARLTRSLAALRIQQPTSPAVLRFIMRQIVDRNRIHNGLIYIQVTRGVARRDHGFPDQAPAPGFIVAGKSIDPRNGDDRAANGVRVITVSDLRWAHPDIKSLQLLPNVLAKQAARERGAYEAWLLDAAGNVTEGASTNAWIVTAGRMLVTRQADQSILRGVTRTTLLALLRSQGLGFEERAFSLSEAYESREAFLTSAVNIVMPVVAIDDHKIGNGRPGPLSLSLRRQFHAFAEASTV